MKKLMKLFLPYVVLIIFLTLVSFAARFLISEIPELSNDVDFQIFILGSLLFIGYYINRIAPRTVIPSFVWAIFAGMAMQPLLSFFIHEVAALKILMEVFAAIILFAGGLEVPFRNFQKWFFPIASLSFFGVVISAITFSFALTYILTFFNGFDVLLIPSIIVLSAALASTDPTAIIPTMKTMRFKRTFLKQIAISESALTDISGSILTQFLLIAFLSVTLTFDSPIFEYFLPLLKKPTYDAFALQIISGILIGYLGYQLVKRFYSHSEDAGQENGNDPALLLSVPIFTFVLGNILAGAGFLAAFISGLLVDVSGSLRRVTAFYDSFLNHLIKPFIFIVLGALVPLSTLIELLPIGVVTALIFMFLIRPFVVFTSLLPWFIKSEFHLRDLIFLSFIRETGIIAAILIVITSTYDIINSEFIIAVGMWVILLTLILQPPLTPYFAELIGVAERKKNKS
ncbi:MAG TPA: cation:proton antiporter [Patescibacteria group bacterium]|nr:cation:proton antiporter [Patescibacteria group bacterium]